MPLTSWFFPTAAETYELLFWYGTTISETFLDLRYSSVCSKIRLPRIKTNTFRVGSGFGKENLGSGQVNLINVSDVLVGSGSYKILMAGRVG